MAKNSPRMPYVKRLVKLFGPRRTNGSELTADNAHRNEKTIPESTTSEPPMVCPGDSVNCFLSKDGILDTNGEVNNVSEILHRLEAHHLSPLPGHPNTLPLADPSSATPSTVGRIEANNEISNTISPAYNYPNGDRPVQFPRGLRAPPTLGLSSTATVDEYVASTGNTFTTALENLCAIVRSDPRSDDADNYGKRKESKGKEPARASTPSIPNDAGTSSRVCGDDRVFEISPSNNHAVPLPRQDNTTCSKTFSHSEVMLSSPPHPEILSDIRSSSTHSPVTFSVPTLRESLTPTVDGVNMPVSSTWIRCVDADLYFGIAEEIQPSLSVMERWECDIFPRLIRDLQSTQTKIRKAKLSSVNDHNIFVELRMSGRKSEESETVTLRPYAWILCGSKWCQKRMKEAVLDIEWVQAYGLSGIEVVVGAPQTSASPSFEQDLQLQFAEYTNTQHRPISEVTISIFGDDAGAGKYKSACGITYIASVERDGCVISETRGILGGILVVDGSTRVWLTTAHGLVSGWLDLLMTTPEVLSDSNDISSEISSMIDSDIEDVSENPSPGQSAVIDLGERDDDALATKISITSFSANLLGFAFKQGSSITQISSGHQLPTPSAVFGAPDFAICFPNDLDSIAYSELRNIYIDRDSRSVEIDNILNENELTDGPVTIILGPENIISGELVPGRHHFSMHGNFLQTFKIRLQSQLRRGSSGAWVVRGYCLCGVILATFDHEPFALALPADKMLSDIKAFTDLGEPRLPVSEQSSSEITQATPFLTRTKEPPGSSTFSYEVTQATPRSRPWTPESLIDEGYEESPHGPYKPGGSSQIKGKREMQSGKLDVMVTTDNKPGFSQPSFDPGEPTPSYSASLCYPSHLIRREQTVSPWTGMETSDAKIG